MKNLYGISLIILLASGCRQAPPQVARPANGPSEQAIVSALLRANEGEVTTGQLAVARASSSAVREYAAMMVSAHSAANAKVATAARASDIRAEEGVIDRQLRTSNSALAKALQGRSGSDFDRIYMQAQVDQHQWLLETLDTSLLPSTRDAALRTLLEETRGDAQSHLQQARQILGTL